jgi:hypothetical protein
VSRMTYQPGMDPHPRRTDCPTNCDGRGLDRHGRRYACMHNGFVGVPFKDLPREGRSLNGSSIPSSACYTAASLDSSNARLMRDTRKPWRAPKLTAEGKPFEPELGEVGSWVRWTTNGVECAGQVFAKAPRPRSVWVVTEAQHVEAIDLAFLTSL